MEMDEKCLLTHCIYVVLMKAPERFGSCLLKGNRGVGLASPAPLLWLNLHPVYSAVLCEGTCLCVCLIYMLRKVKLRLKTTIFSLW